MSSHIIPKVDIRMSLRKGVSLITGMEVVLSGGAPTPAGTAMLTAELVLHSSLFIKPQNQPVFGKL